MENALGKLGAVAGVGKGHPLLLLDRRVVVVAIIQHNVVAGTAFTHDVLRDVFGAGGILFLYRI